MSYALQHFARSVWGVAIGALALCLMLSLAGCATTPAVREVTVTKEVPVPYHEPCPKAGDKPVVPKHVAEERPVMPADPREQVLILAAKVVEMFSYADRADGVMTACAKP